jgi:hypothetical protein
MESRRCFETWGGGDAVSHGAASGLAGARLKTTGETACRSATIIVDANTVPDGLDSDRCDCAQQSSAAACVIRVGEVLSWW